MRSLFSDDQQGNAKKQLFYLFAPVVSLGIVGILFFSSYYGSLRILSISLILSAASMACGALLGFLFGIPKTLQQNSELSADTKTDYLANTNLEQISDWLTKIIVGVSLTQIGKAPRYLDQFGNELSKALANDQSSKIASITLLVFFGVVGFMFGFLTTRLFLKNAFVSADSLNILAEINKLKDQSGIDAAAIGLVNKKLHNSGGIEEREIDLSKLSDFIVNASPAAKVSIFYAAQKVRSDNWRDNKEIMERTIPIFEALCKSDTDNRFHQNYGQLAYALKDKVTPDYRNAEKAFTKAISIRGNGQEHGWLFYEFNRAICRIMNDDNFINGKVSDEKTKEKILADINLAYNDDYVRSIIQEDENINKWLKLNQIVL